MTKINSTMRVKVAVYWTFTAILLLQTATGAVMDLTRNRAFADSSTHLGYPLYLLPILGVLRIVAFIAIIVPDLRFIKDWAYAGLFFEFVLASISHISVGDTAGQWIFPVIFALITVGSSVLRPSPRKIATL